MHQQGALAYQQTANVVASSRERESALLMKAAAGLQKVKDEWPGSFDGLKPALTFNRKLWTILMASVMKDDNPLPSDVRQNVANIGMFILNQTREILLEPYKAPHMIDGLVQINRQLAAGLRGV
ncbi:flagellar biosynthesis regulator FlaF [Devosia sp.]|uniref:flagellar biosynthesis regulator FlaF n=1 Tax=Devosia sp. TaxID=1871048 RepID=UPI002FC5DB94